MFKIIEKEAVGGLVGGRASAEQQNFPHSTFSILLSSLLVVAHPALE